jgi:hypothetical protein
VRGLGLEVPNKIADTKAKPVLVTDSILIGSYTNWRTIRQVDLNVYVSFFLSALPDCKWWIKHEQRSLRNFSFYTLQKYVAQ